MIANSRPKPFVWLTGLPGAGKSTIAGLVRGILTARGCAAAVLDGDTLRRGLCRDLGFTREDRAENVRRIGEVGWIMADAGMWVLAAVIAPYQRDRDLVRARSPERFIEVFVDTPLELCEARDPKGLYARARRGELAGLTGLDGDYEVPDAPELIVNTQGHRPEDSAATLVAWLDARREPFGANQPAR